MQDATEIWWCNKNIMVMVSWPYYICMWWRDHGLMFNIWLLTILLFFNKTLNVVYSRLSRKWAMVDHHMNIVLTFLHFDVSVATWWLFIHIFKSLCITSKYKASACSGVLEGLWHDIRNGWLMEVSFSFYVLWLVQYVWSWFCGVNCTTIHL